MNVNQPKAKTGELAFFNKEQDLVGFHQGSAWQRFQQRKHLFARPEVTAGELAYHERMADYFAVMQESPQPRFAPSEMFNPNRGVSEHHAEQRSFAEV